MADTKRPLNRCSECGHTWYPRGSDRSTRCPRCGEEPAPAPALSPGASQFLSTLIGCLVLAVAVPVLGCCGIGWLGSRGPSGQTEKQPQAPAVEKPVVADVKHLDPAPPRPEALTAIQLRQRGAAAVGKHFRVSGRARVVHWGKEVLVSFKDGRESVGASLVLRERFGSKAPGPDDELWGDVTLEGVVRTYSDQAAMFSLIEAEVVSVKYDEASPTPPVGKASPRNEKEPTRPALAKPESLPKPAEPRDYQPLDLWRTGEKAALRRVRVSGLVLVRQVKGGRFMAHFVTGDDRPRRLVSCEVQPDDAGGLAGKVTDEARWTLTVEGTVANVANGVVLLSDVRVTRADPKAD